MDGFLVEVIGTVEDLAVGLHATHEAAQEQAQRLANHYADGGKGTAHHPDVQHALEHVGSDGVNVVNVGVVTFVGGKVVDYDLVEAAA